MNPDPKLSWRSRNVLLLGLVSLLTDTASEMVIPLLPAFITGVLGAGALALGWIEGLADAVASVLKLLSGRWADHMGRRRPLVLAGYTTSSVVRPLIALAGSVWHVLGVRVADRVGKGLRTSPRDALIAGSVAPEHHASAFGLHRAMDHAGAVLGPLIAAAYLALGHTDLRTLFWLTAIPGAAAVAVILVGVREVGSAPAPRPTPAPQPVSSGPLVRLLIPVGLFTLGNASDTFLLLKAGQDGGPLVTLPLLWIGLHLVKSATSVPGGRLADRIGRRRVLTLGWLFYAAIYVGFALVESRAAVWTLFVVYGGYHGLTEGAERGLVAELVPGAKLGSAFGWFHLTLGLATLGASVLFGALWQGQGPRVAFLASAMLALAAVVCLHLLAPRRPAG